MRKDAPVGGPPDSLKELVNIEVLAHELLHAGRARFERERREAKAGPHQRFNPLFGEDIGSEAVLSRYARWRGVDNVAIALSTDIFTRLFSNDNPVLRAARGAGMAVVNRIGPARRFFMQEAGGAVGDLPRLLRGEAL